MLVAAALGGVLSLLWLRRRALVAASAGVLAVVVFAAFATAGLPINTRYAFLASAILCVFAGAGVFGWTRLARGDPRRPWWMGAGALVLVALIAYAPSQYRAAHRELSKLARQQTIQDELLALVKNGSLSLACGPVGVPNHAPIPLLALYLKTSPANIVSAAGRLAPDPRRTVRRPRERRSRRRLRARPARPARAGQRAARLHRGARRRLVADLPALHLGAASTLVTDRAPRVEASAPTA